VSANYQLLPGHLRDGMQRYMEFGIEPGGFLRAVLENNFEMALSRADMSLERSDLDAIVFFLQTLPSDAWGSPAIVQAWIKGHEERAAQRRADFGPHGDATTPGFFKEP
jgi:hypothetical protein